MGGEFDAPRPFARVRAQTPPPAPLPQGEGGLKKTHLEMCESASLEERERPIRGSEWEGEEESGRAYGSAPRNARPRQFRATGTSPESTITSMVPASGVGTRSGSSRAPKRLSCFAAVS